MMIRPLGWLISGEEEGEIKGYVMIMNLCEVTAQWTGRFQPQGHDWGALKDTNKLTRPAYFTTRVLLGRDSSLVAKLCHLHIDSGIRLDEEGTDHSGSCRSFVSFLWKPFWHMMTVCVFYCWLCVVDQHKVAYSCEVEGNATVCKTNFCKIVCIQLTRTHTSPNSLLEPFFYNYSHR